MSQLASLISNTADEGLSVVPFDVWFPLGGFVVFPGPGGGTGVAGFGGPGVADVGGFGGPGFAVVGWFEGPGVAGVGGFEGPGVAGVGGLGGPGVAGVGGFEGPGGDVAEFGLVPPLGVVVVFSIWH